MQEENVGEYLLGIDVGTSACKVALFDLDGRLVRKASAEYGVLYRKPGWAEQNPADWWAGACSAIRQLFEAPGVSPEDVLGIGIDGQSWSAVALGKSGEALTNTPIWMDGRSEEICKQLKQKIGERELFGLCGNPLQPTYTTGKVLWYKESLPLIYERTEKILSSNGYLAYRLTGEICQDISQCYGWHCFDMRAGSWNDEVCRAMGIDPRLLPTIVSCDQVIGRVHQEAAAETGLKVGTPVVAGGLDAACGTLGAGVFKDGETQEQGGQAGGMSICMDEYQAEARLILSYHVVPGKWLLQGGTTGGGGVMRWFEKEFAGYERIMEKETGKSSLNQLNALAEAVAPGCDGLIFLPYMSGERSPIWNPKAKGVFYGLDFSKTKGHMVRACMEGVAFSLKHNLDVAEAAGAHVEKLCAVGGSAKSHVWTQIKSDITGKPISISGSEEATAHGAALLAGVGIGLYRSYEEAVSRTVHEVRRHEPNLENTVRYKEAYENYLLTYEALKSRMR